MSDWCNFFEDFMKGWKAGLQESAVPEAPKSMFVGRPYERWGGPEPAGKEVFDQMMEMGDMQQPLAEDQIGMMRG